MTKVTLEKTGSENTGYWYTVEADGHAYTVNKDGTTDGKQFVCIAVSVIMQTLHTWLVWHNAAVSEAKIDSGSSRLRFSGRGCRTAFEIAYCGFRRLAETNPDCIQCEARIT